MRRKNLSLSKEIFLPLKRKKKRNEKFARISDKLFKNKEAEHSESIDGLFGKFKEEIPGEWEIIEENLYLERLNITRFVNWEKFEMI